MKIVIQADFNKYAPILKKLGIALGIVLTVAVIYFVGKEFIPVERLKPARTVQR